MEPLLIMGGLFAGAVMAPIVAVLVVPGLALAALAAIAGRSPGAAADA